MRQHRCPLVPSATVGALPNYRSYPRRGPEGAAAPKIFAVLKLAYEAARQGLSAGCIQDRQWQRSEGAVGGRPKDVGRSTPRKALRSLPIEKLRFFRRLLDTTVKRV